MAAVFTHSLPAPLSCPVLSATSSPSPIGASFRRRAPAAAAGLRIARLAPPPAARGGRVRRGRAVVCEAQETTAIQVPDVTKSTWQSLVLECDKPVLVEFWAPWCGPCRMLDPVIGKLSKIYEGKLGFFKINTDDSQDIATQYGIRSIPTIMIFKNGEKKDAVIGAVPETTLVTCIEKFV